MRVEYHFKNMEHSQAMKDHCQEQIDKISHYLHHDFHAQVFFKTEGYQTYVDVHVHSLQHEHKATAKGQSFPMAIDKAFDKMHRQLHKTKEKVKDHKGRKRAKDKYAMPQEIEMYTTDDKKAG